MLKRICLFAGYDDQGIIDDYVIYYINSLALISDVHYLADCKLKNGELEKIKNITVSARCFRHGKYDFGSWQNIMQYIGKETLNNYDELILANDSCFGPVFQLNEIFNKMNNFDFWGITKNYEIKAHIQTYFIVFKKRVFMSNSFLHFFNNIHPHATFWDVVINYELQLNYLLQVLVGIAFMKTLVI